MIELSGLFELRLLLRNSEEKEIVMVEGRSEHPVMSDLMVFIFPLLSS